MSALIKKKTIYQKDLEEANILANHHPEPDLLYSLAEIADLIEDLIGITMPKGSNGKVLDGPAREHWFNNETWNRKLQLRVNQIRYLIALAPPPKFRVTTLILLTGAQIINVFGVSPKATIKNAMPSAKTKPLPVLRAEIVYCT